MHGEYGVSVGQHPYVWSVWLGSSNRLDVMSPNRSLESCLAAAYIYKTWYDSAWRVRLPPACSHSHPLGVAHLAHTNLSSPLLKRIDEMLEARYSVGDVLVELRRSKHINLDSLSTDMTLSRDLLCQRADVVNRAKASSSG